MRFYGQAERAASRILAAFQSGSLPQALAPVFIRRNDNAPCRQWSWNNQLLVALMGFDDARGFRQWQAVGRCVRKGEKGFPILAPCTRKIEEKADDGRTVERVVVTGFRHAIVFGLPQTDGDPLSGDERVAAFLDALPLRAVAESWGLSVSAVSGAAGRALGWYRRKQAIAVGVENLSTWTHELVHAADDRLGALVERGQHWRSETVAELGGAILLECLGHPVEADRGGCWEYVSAYARDAGLEPIAACTRVLKRTCDAVALILDTADKLAQTESGVAHVAL